MLPGNFQYWQPSKRASNLGVESFGTIRNKIIEPIHFSGPSPGDQSAIAKEEKKEEPETSQPDQPPVIDKDDPLGPAQQSPTEETTPAQKVIKEEIKAPEPSQTVEPAAGAAMSAPSVDASP